MNIDASHMPPGFQAQILAQLCSHNAAPAKPKRAKPYAPTANNLIFTETCRRFGLPAPVAEYRFHPTRKWRFDYAWPEQMVALEVEGGVWTGGRHTRGVGFMNDQEKYNRASEFKWWVFRRTPDTLCTVDTLEMLRRVLL